MRRILASFVLICSLLIGLQQYAHAQTWNGQANIKLSIGNPNVLCLLPGSQCVNLGSFTTGGLFTPFANQLSKPETGSYTILAADRGYVIQFNSASAATATLNTSAYAAGFVVDIVNIGAGTITITPTTGQINGNSSFSLAQGSSGHIVFDGTNYIGAFGASGVSSCSLFTSTAQGCVPASGGGTSNFIRADGTWATPLAVFDPTAAPYNAKGDGVTDDTAAWQSMCSAINTAGGGWIVSPPGKIYKIFSSSASLASTTLCSIANVNYFHLDMNGSSIHSYMAGQANIGGTATAGDTIAINFQSLYGTFATQYIQITVTAGETTAQMATAMVNAINANTTLSANSIAATANGSTVNITPTGNQITWWMGSTTGIGMGTSGANTETINPSYPVVFQFVNSQRVSLNDVVGIADSFIASNGPNGSSVDWIGCSNAGSSTGFSCRDVSVTRANLNGGFQGFFINRTPGTGTAGYGVHVDGTFANIGYPMENQFDGWNTDFRIYTINAGRSYIGYNTSGVKGYINSYRPGYNIGLQDCDVTVYGYGANPFVDLSQNTTSNFDLTYVNRLSTYYGNSFFNLSHQQADPVNANIPTELANITFHSDIYLHNNPVVGFLAMQAFKGHSPETPGDVSGDIDNNIVITGTFEGTEGTQPNSCALSTSGAYCQGFSGLATGTYHLVDLYAPQLKWSQGVNALMIFDNYNSYQETIPTQDTGTPNSMLEFRPPVNFSGLILQGISCTGINAGTFNVIAGAVSHC